MTAQKLHSKKRERIEKKKGQAIRGSRLGSLNYEWTKEAGRLRRSKEKEEEKAMDRGAKFG
jgi:hypothetical protein